MPSAVRRPARAHAALLAVAAALVPTACSSSAPKEGAVTVSAPITVAWDNGAAGAIEIPAEPQRVVLVDPSPATLAIARTEAADRVVAVVSPRTPVGVEGPQLADGWTRIEGPVRARALARLDPDLVVAPAGDEAAARLGPLAPVALLPSSGADDWRGASARAGDVLGVGDETRARISVVDARLAELRGLLAPATTLSLIEVRGGGMDGRPGAYPAPLIDELGLEPPDLLRPAPRSGECCVPLTLDELDKADADYVFVAVDRTDAAREEYATLRDDPLWQALGAYQREDLSEVDARSWTVATLPGVEGALEDVASHIVASQGTPASER